MPDAANPSPQWPPGDGLHHTPGSTNGECKGISPKQVMVFHPRLNLAAYSEGPWNAWTPGGIAIDQVSSIST
jgi:hypothetical protein